MITLIKTFPENWDSKAPSVGTLLAYLGTMAKIIYFMFFKIESGNFQHLFEKEFRKTLRNFNSFSSFRQLFFHMFYWLSD
jgi:hypothetical protein